MIGQLLGHYRVISKIGEGGMGVVYRAHDEVLHRDVALKVLAREGVLDQSSRQFLLREARAACAVSHPNLCTVYEIGEFDGEPFIVMELVDGKPLNTMIGTNGLPVESVMRYGAQIAAALSHAHSRNLAHRDLKSSNIVVTKEGLVKILDFGLARRLPGEAFSEAETISAATSDGSIVGTLSYMAPEVLRGKLGDYLSDIWALGVVLFEAASGQLPFRGATAFEISSAILHDLPPAMPSNVPPMLQIIILRCMAKEPAQRYQRAGEVQAALEAAQFASAMATEQSSDPKGPQSIVHRGIRHLTVKNGDVLLLIGTTKGAFLARSSPSRSRWDMAGPYFPGQSVFSMAYDDRRGRHRIWASTCSAMWGTFLRWTDNYGRTWINPQESQIKFPPETGLALKNVWQICIGRPEEPDVLYCGVEPAALFRSNDVGETWSLVRALYDHPHRPRWIPGNGGLILHSIVLDPADCMRMYVGISCAGVYVTENGGEEWRASNRGIRVVFAPETYPEFGQCVHKIVSHPSRPDRLFLQNHWGLYRSDDAAQTWQDIANGIPSDFGFAMAIHPHHPDWVYVIPVESDEFRCTPDGRLRVYRTRNDGGSWEPLTRGLSQKGAYETILRDALTVDQLNPAGIYFGTRSGDVYGSVDDGKSWRKILEGLPPVVCLKAVIPGEPRGSARLSGKSERSSSKSRPTKSARQTAISAKTSRKTSRTASPADRATSRKTANRAVTKSSRSASQAKSTTTASRSASRVTAKARSNARAVGAGADTTKEKRKGR